MSKENPFDEAVAAVRDEPIDAETMRAGLARVERRLAAEAAAPAEEVPGESPHAIPHLIEGCAGFRSLMPAYRAGALAESRRRLVEDHLRECVPCRHALAALERGEPTVTSAPVAPARRRAGGLALAAGLAAAALGAAALWLIWGRGPAPSARVAAVDGELVALSSGTIRAVAAGETVGEGLPVRTGSQSRAVLELADGSRIELAPRSELALDRRRDGVVLALRRGSLIVEAAPQHDGHLYVRTDDCLVSVVGTIFAVDHGARGSRVAVLEGEVRVRQGAELAVLRPGDQLATTTRLARVPLAEEVAWSRNAAAYRERIAALTALGRELDEVLAAPGRRTSTRLLDLAPPATAVYIAVPNLAGALSDAWATIEQRAAENPALADWWRERFGGGERAREIRDALTELRRVGERLGPEVVIADALEASGRPGAPVVLAEVSSPAGFTELLDEEIARMNGERDGRAPVVRVTDPAAAPAGERQLLVWLAPGDVLVASPSAARLAEIGRALAAGGESTFVGTPFHARLAASYAGGTEWLLAVDAGSLLAASIEHGSSTEHVARGRQELAALGLADVNVLVAESRDEDGMTVNRARLDFRAERRGLASWLAAPAPLGAAEFVSGDAALAVAGVVKSPAGMFDDLLALAARDGDARTRVAEIEDRLGVSLRDDLASALGGDFALAVDGPWLPTPSWKLVVEVLDAGRLEHAVGRLVEAWNDEADRRAAKGAEASRPSVPRLVWSQEEAGGRLYRRLATPDGRVLFEATVADGYLIVAPSRALLVATLARRAAGDTLVASTAFQERLPRDAEPDFSAFVWQNLGPGAADLARLVGGVAGGEATPGLDALVAHGPTLALAYGGSDELSLVAVGARGPLGLSLESLLTLAESVHAGEREHGAAPAPAAETPSRPAA
jgi:ferric-dicitrate binding protein FerR (iron transport regulator)